MIIRNREFNRPIRQSIQIPHQKHIQFAWVSALVGSFAASDHRIELLELVSWIGQLTDDRFESCESVGGDAAIGETRPDSPLTSSSESRSVFPKCLLSTLGSVERLLRVCERPRSRPCIPPLIILIFLLLSLFELVSCMADEERIREVEESLRVEGGGDLLLVRVGRSRVREVEPLDRDVGNPESLR